MIKEAVDMTVTIEKLENNQEWTSFVQSCPYTGIFYSIKWKELIEKNFRIEPLYLVARNGAGKVVVYAPGFITGNKFVKIFESTPYSDYGGPIYSDVEVARYFKVFLYRYLPTKGIAYGKICLKPKDAKLFDLICGKSIRRGVMEIDLKFQTPEAIWLNSFSSNTRRKIRKLDRSEFQAYTLTSKEQLFGDFYRVYSATLNRKCVIPFQESFIESVYSNLYPSNVRIWLMGKRTVIGALFVLKHLNISHTWLLGYDQNKAANFPVYEYLCWKEIFSIQAGRGRDNFSWLHFT